MFACWSQIEHLRESLKLQVVSFRVPDLRFLPRRNADPRSFNHRPFQGFPA